MRLAQRDLRQVGRFMPSGEEPGPPPTTLTWPTAEPGVELNRHDQGDEEPGHLVAPRAAGDGTTQANSAVSDPVGGWPVPPRAAPYIPLLVPVLGVLKPAADVPGLEQGRIPDCSTREARHLDRRWPILDCRARRRSSADPERRGRLGW